MKRYPIPDEIENKMKLWRMGAIPLPQAYIDFQKEAAEKDLPTLLKLMPNHKILHTYMADDGWFDGMEVLHVLLETPRGDVKKVKFSDGQTWFEHIRGGAGWSVVGL